MKNYHNKNNPILNMITNEVFMITHDRNNSSKKNKKVEKTLPQNKILQYLELINSLTNSERAILVSLFDICQARFFDKKSLEINPSCKYLAKKSKVNIKTVKNFNKKIKEMDAFKNVVQIKRISVRGRQHLNRYEVSKDFLKAMFLMKFCGSFFSKNYRQRLLSQYAQNEQDTIKKLTFKLQKLHRVKPKNCTALTTLFNIPIEDSKVPIAEVPISLKWQGININLQQKDYFLRNYPLKIIEKGIEDLKFYTLKRNNIESNFAVLYSRVKDHDYRRACKWRN